MNVEKEKPAHIAERVLRRGFRWHLSLCPCETRRIQKRSEKRRKKKGKNRAAKGADSPQRDSGLGFRSGVERRA